MQSQINEISASLFTVKEGIDQEIAQLKAQTSNDFSGIIEDVIPSVVSVGTDVSQGSGFIVSEDGFIITNAHVLEGGAYVRILTYESDQWQSAELIGYNATLDIAVLKAQGNSFEPIDFDSSEVKVGEKAIALGNPLGLSFSVTEGIISALDRTGPNEIPAYIQIDVPLNPGNSGGPLVSKQGRVIGINNFKIQGSENLGFALESEYAVNTINDILGINNESLRV